MKLILPAYKIPDRTYVTKPTGGEEIPFVEGWSQGLWDGWWYPFTFT